MLSMMMMKRELILPVVVLMMLLLLYLLEVYSLNLMYVQHTMVNENEMRRRMLYRQQHY
jgi:hypothetical protein